jgi:hypothetical protein
MRWLVAQNLDAPINASSVAVLFQEAKILAELLQGRAAAPRQIKIAWGEVPSRNRITSCNFTPDQGAIEIASLRDADFLVDFAVASRRPPASPPKTLFESRQLRQNLTD